MRIIWERNQSARKTCACRAARNSAGQLRPPHAAVKSTRKARRQLTVSCERMGTFNYFNYFTEIEEYFWQKRGAHLLVSPLDWAIVETWQKAGIPLEAVLRGIDTAFESYQRSRRAAGRPLKSLAYCVDAVLDAATQQKEIAAGQGPSGNASVQATVQAPLALHLSPFRAPSSAPFSPAMPNGWRTRPRV